MLAPQTATQGIRSIERETPLTLPRAFDGSTDFTIGHGFRGFTRNAHRIGGPHDLIPRGGE
jgi:hypothetical protein